MKKLSLLSLLLIGVISCSSSSPETKIYIEHFGMLDPLKSEGLTTFYSLEGSEKLFDKNKNEIKTKNTTISDYLNEREPINFLGTDLVIFYNESFVNNVKEIQDKIVEISQKENVTFDELYNYVVLFNRYYNGSIYDFQITDMASRLYREYNYTELYNSLADLLLDYDQFSYSLPVIFYNTKYEEDYYKTFLDINNKEDVDRFYNSLEPSKHAKIISSYYDIEKTKNAYNEKSDYVETFRKIDMKGYELARESNYSNYIDYLYKRVNERDYLFEKFDDDGEIKTYIINYILPVYLNLSYETKILYDTLTEKEKEFYLNLENFPLTSNLDLFNNYATTFNNNYKKYYQDYIASGYYFFRNSSINSSFSYSSFFGNGTSSPYMVFSNENQNIYNFAYEFGHIFCSYINPFHSLSDFVESVSLGNTYVFLLYIINNNDISLNLKNYILYEFLLSLALKSLSSFAYIETENYFVKHSDFISKEQIQVKYDNYLCEMGLDFLVGDKSWEEMFLKNMGYAPSYLSSYLTLLQMYSMNGFNFELTLELYKKLIFISKKYTKYKYILNYIGMKDVFDEDAFILIYKAFNN